MRLSQSFASEPRVIINIGGARGPSSYDLWLRAGNVGTLEDFYADMLAGIDLVVTEANGGAYSNRALITALGAPVPGQAVYLSQEGYNGHFVFLGGNMAAVAAQDPQRIRYLVPDGTDGSMGVWSRIHTYGRIRATWAGVVTDQPAQRAANTLAAQAALNYCVQVLGSARLIFPRRPAHVGKLFIPGLDVRQPASLRVLSIEGDTTPSPNFGTIGTAPLSNDPAIIQSDAVGDALLTVQPFLGNPANGNVSALYLNLKDITLRLYDNPAAHGVDALWAAQLSMDGDVVVENGLYSVDASEPTHDTQAVRTPAINNAAINHMNRLHIWGFNSGIGINEHCRIEYLNVTCCKFAMDFYGHYHSSSFGRLALQRNQVNMRFSDGTCYFTVDEVNTEYPGNFPGQITPANAWQQKQWDVLDPNNFGHAHLPVHQVEGGKPQPVTKDWKQSGGLYISHEFVGYQPVDEISFFTLGANRSVASGALNAFLEFDIEGLLGGGVKRDAVDKTRINFTQPGCYEVSFKGAFQLADGGDRLLGLHRNGVLLECITGKGSAVVDTCMKVEADVMNATVGQYLQVRAFHNQGGPVNVLNTNFSGVLTIRKIRKEPI